MGIRPPNPLSYAGQIAIPNINRPFPPNSTFNDFPVPTIWVDTAGEDAYILVSVALGVAEWVRIGGTPTDIYSLTGDDGVEVISDANGNVNVLGAAVASATHAKPFFFKQSATSTLTGDIQVGSAAASSNINNAGLSSFNNAHFSVDANGFVGLVGGQQAIDSFIPDSGTNPVVPNGAGAVTMTGTSGMTIVGGTNTLSHYAYVPSKWVVDPTANVGTHTTITAALAAASAGQNIFVKPGTYTENLTLKAGVNIVAFPGDADTPNVTIIGNCTATFAGACTISNIRLQTNGAALLTVSGSNATQVHIENCYLNMTNSTGIVFSASNTSALIDIFDCDGDLGTTGIKIFDQTSTGVLYFIRSDFSNTGSSASANTASAGNIVIQSSSFNHKFDISGTAGIHSSTSGYADPSGVIWTISSVPTPSFFGGNATNQDTLSAGAAACIDVSSGITVRNSVLLCNGPVVISGTGTVSYWTTSVPGNGTFPNTSNTGAYTLTGAVSFDTGANYLKRFIDTSSFTPTVAGATTPGTATYVVQSGRYSVIGNWVFFNINLEWTGHTGTGDMLITGFPYIFAAAQSFYPCTCMMQNIVLPAGTLWTVVDGVNNSTQAEIIASLDNASNQNVQMDAAGSINVTGFYPTNP